MEGSSWNFAMFLRSYQSKHIAAVMQEMCGSWSKVAEVSFCSHLCLPGRERFASSRLRRGETAGSPHTDRHTHTHTPKGGYGIARSSPASLQILGIHPIQSYQVSSVGLSPRRRSLHLRPKIIDTRTTIPELYIHINQTHARSRRLVGLAILATATGVVIDVRKSRGRPPAERPCRPSRSCLASPCPA